MQLFTRNYRITNKLDIKDIYSRKHIVGGHANICCRKSIADVVLPPEDSILDHPVEDHFFSPAPLPSATFIFTGDEDSSYQPKTQVG